MDQALIERLVSDVLAHLARDEAGARVQSGPPTEAPATPLAVASKPMPATVGAPVNEAAQDGLPDLGSEEIRLWVGVDSPSKPDVVKALRGSTRARVCVGRRGPRPRTTALLRFLADHSRSKDTVMSEIPSEWVQTAGLLEVHTQATEINQYLTRPDLGRVLCDEGKAALRDNCVQQPDVQIVVSDGLSTEAITANFEEILPPLNRYLTSAGLSLGTSLFVRYGRVKVEDQIGQLLGAKVVILLIGERPGLGQSESMSCYAVYKPTATTVEAGRTCISNIHRSGTPPVEAAAVIAELAQNMIRHEASGIALTQRMQAGAS